MSAKIRVRALGAALMILMFLPISLLMSGLMEQAAPIFFSVLILVVPARLLARFGATPSIVGCLILCALPTVLAYFLWGFAPYLVALSIFTASVCFTSNLTSARPYGGGRFLTGVSVYLISAWVAHAGAPLSFSAYILPSCAVFLLLGFLALNREGLSAAFMSSERYSLPKQLRSKNTRLTLLIFSVSLIIALGWQPVVRLLKLLWAYLMTLESSTISGSSKAPELIADPKNPLFDMESGDGWDVPLEKDFYLAPYIMLALTLALFAALAAMILSKAIRGIPELKKFWARMLVWRGETAEMDESEDIPESLRYREDAGMMVFARRFMRRIRFDRLGDNRKKVRAALYALLYASPDELKFLTPSELKEAREGSERLLMDDYNTARYSENPVPDSAAANARTVFNAYRRKTRA